jgi:hypothetical protein
MEEQKEWRVNAGLGRERGVSDEAAADCGAVFSTEGAQDLLF